MAESSSTSLGSTATVTETEVTEPENRSLTIKLRKRKPAKKVEWSSDTVDNEHMGRRSSKCCCIYEKPRAFGESSTESEDEDNEGCGNIHCTRGHKKGQPAKAQGNTGDSGKPESSPQKSEPPDQNHAEAMQH